MANTPLTGNTISSSYQGLLKAGDSGAIGATEKTITDGLANASTLSLGTSSASFTGTLDLSGATVTGLPAGAAGLESGTGTDSMQSAASLTTNAANAAGDKSIALGDGATSNPFSTNGIAIGTSALNQSPNGTAIGVNSYSRDGGVSVGNSSIAYNANDCALGNNADANGGSSTAVGHNATVASNKYHGVAVGRDSSVTGEFAGAFGSNASATANGAYAIGQGVTAATADTVSVKALETQTNSTPTAGGIIMNDAGSTARRLNITAAGALQIDSTPVGGGGGAEALYGQNFAPFLGTGIFNIPWNLSGYSTTNATAFNSVNSVFWIPFFAKPGESINDFYFKVATGGGAGALMNVALYKSYQKGVISAPNTYAYTMPEYVATIANNVDVSTNGSKVINLSSSPITLPTDAVGGQYWIAFQTNNTSVYLQRWSQWIADQKLIYSSIYRGNGCQKAEATFALPTGQVDLSAAPAAGPSTDMTIDFAWRYLG